MNFAKARKIRAFRLPRGIQHIVDENAVARGRVIHQHMCVLMMPTKPLNFGKPRIQVNHDFTIGSLVVVNFFKNDF